MSERIELTPAMMADPIIRALFNIEGYIAELYAAAEDATRPLKRRVWSRARARKRIERARASAKEEIARVRTDLLAAKEKATAERRCACRST
jgi:hypothetical protein